MPSLLEQAVKFEKEEKELLKQRALQYISEFEGKPFCNWEVLAGINNDVFLGRNERRVFESTYKAVLNELMNKKILTYEGTLKAYFLLSTHRMDASPRDKDGTIYWFKEKEEAKRFKEAWYKTAYYGVSIAQLIEH